MLLQDLEALLQRVVLLQRRREVRLEGGQPLLEDADDLGAEVGPGPLLRVPLELDLQLLHPLLLLRQDVRQLLLRLDRRLPLALHPLAAAAQRPVEAVPPLRHQRRQHRRVRQALQLPQTVRQPLQLPVAVVRQGAAALRLRLRLPQPPRQRLDVPLGGPRRGSRVGGGRGRLEVVDALLQVAEAGAVRRPLLTALRLQVLQRRALRLELGLQPLAPTLRRVRRRLQARRLVAGLAQRRLQPPHLRALRVHVRPQPRGLALRRLGLRRRGGHRSLDVLDLLLQHGLLPLRIPQLRRQPRHAVGGLLPQVGDVLHHRVGQAPGVRVLHVAEGADGRQRLLPRRRTGRGPLVALGHPVPQVVRLEVLLHDRS